MTFIADLGGDRRFGLWGAMQGISLQKRLFDIALALSLAPVVVPVLLLLMGWLLIRQGRPVFYRGERMRTPDTPFTLYKLRSMTEANCDQGVTGGDKIGRITPVGRWLRASRLDELPQLWNILRGDMSFVGPRPPLRDYVARYPDLYSHVLRCRPGLTGLATLRYHGREWRLLGQCRTAAETDAVYVARCLPQKARLDLIYQRHQSITLDLALIGSTCLCLWGQLGRVLR